MTQEPERIDEAMHHREGAEEGREVHTGAENPHRVPVKEPGEEEHVELPDLDQDQHGSEEVRERTRHDMH